MSASNDRPEKDRPEQDTPQESPKKGGFGAFSQQYRDRWAAGHPKRQPSTSDGAGGVAPPTPADPADPSSPSPTGEAGAPDGEARP